MTATLRRGVLAGLVAGAALAAFLLAVGERSIRAAIALEEAQGGPATDAPFTRPEQVAGGAAGAVVYGLLLGAVFAVAFAAVRHRLHWPTDWHRSVALAAAGFVTVALVPALKYPPNPPAVGDPATVTRRTLLWMVLLAWSALTAWAAWRTQRALADRSWPLPARATATVATYAALVAVALVVLPPSPDAVDAPATLVWDFRVAALGGQLVLWAALGLAFGWLADRARPVGARS